MKKLLSMTLLALSLFATAQVADYQVVPLPQSIERTDTVHCFALHDGDLVTFTSETPADGQMARNAQFLCEYVEQSTGMKLAAIETATQKGKQKNQPKAAIRLSLLPTKKLFANAEEYRISVSTTGIHIEANTPEGIFRGIQTLRKSLPVTQKHGSPVAATPEVTFPLAVIQDKPRFEYRGQMLDVARHFVSADYMKRYIDILALHGINQLHWHLTDDQGWRFDLKSMPELAPEASIRKQTVIGHNCYSQGAYLFDETEYGRGCYYTHDQLREIVRYASERYINIIPEIDLPGHMVAALHVLPQLGCTGGPYDVYGIWGVTNDVLCAGNPETLTFLKTVLGEVCEVFPSKYIHIGGDESPRTRWQHCPRCQAKMKELGLTREAQLQTYINKELETFLAQHGRTIIGWDETLEGGLSDSAIVMSWRGYEGGIEAARLGHRVIMSPTSHCYIDYYQLTGETRTQPLSIGGYLPLSKVYSMEPIPAELTDEEKQYIWGAQCNLWTEYVLSSQHVEYMLLPRLAAMSEVQWVQPQSKDYAAFLTRLERYKKLYSLLGLHYCSKQE